MRADGQCRSCGAPVRWARSKSTGQAMPLDPPANPNGNLGVVEIVEQHGKALSLPVVAVNPTRSLTEYRYLSHFVTCPNASTHRRPR